MKNFLFPPAAILLAPLLAVVMVMGAEVWAIDKSRFENADRGATALAASIAAYLDAPGAESTRLRQAVQTFAEEVARLEQSVDSRGDQEADDDRQLTGVYLAARDTLADHDWLAEQDRKRIRLRRTTELLGKPLPGTLLEVDLLPFANLTSPQSNDEISNRLSALVRKYALRTEQRKFDSKTLRGVYGFISAGWSGKMLATGLDLLTRAGRLYNGEPGPQAER